MSHPTQRDIYVPPGGPPQTPSPSREIYQQMGEENIFIGLSLKFVVG